MDVKESAPWILFIASALSGIGGWSYQGEKLEAEIKLGDTHVQIIHDFADAVKDQCE